MSVNLCGSAKRAVWCGLLVMGCAAPLALADLYSHEPWQSGFDTAGGADAEHARPIVEARERWQSLSDAERAQMMAKHRRANLRGGGVYVARPEPEPDPAAEKSKEGNKPADTKAGKADAKGAKK